MARLFPNFSSCRFDTPVVQLACRSGCDCPLVICLGVNRAHNEIPECISSSTRMQQVTGVGPSMR